LVAEEGDLQLAGRKEGVWVGSWKMGVRGMVGIEDWQMQLETDQQLQGKWKSLIQDE